MQATQQNLSTIKLHFGKPLSSLQNTPLCVNLQLHLFSQQQKVIRQNIENKINQTLQKTCLVFEIKVKNGSADDLASSLKILAQQNVPQGSPNTVEFRSSGNTLYIICSGQYLTQLTEVYENLLKEISNQVPGADQQNQHITFKILSKNSLNEIVSLCKVSQFMGFFDSLTVQLQFLKTRLTGRFIPQLLKSFTGIETLQILSKSFKQVNLEINCASSRFLQELQDLQFHLINLAVPSQKDNPIANYIKQSGTEQVKVYLLNNTILLTGSIRAQGIQALIQSNQ